MVQTKVYYEMLEDPRNYVEAPYDAGFALTRAQLESIHLHGIQQLFARLRPRVAALGKLADEQGIAAIRRVDDVAPLLFPHSIYKSYPGSIVDRGEFARLTRWLAGLTSVGLGAIAHEGLCGVDDWIDQLERATSLQVAHTFGTLGRLSFIPRTRNEWRLGARLVANCIRDWHGRGTGPDLIHVPRPIVQPSYRRGANAAIRGVQTLVELFAGGEGNALYLYPDGRYSADVALLAARLKVAELRGGQDSVALPHALIQRQREIVEQEKLRPELLRRFFQQVEEQMAGRDIYLFGVWPVLFDWAHEGLNRGFSAVFGAGSILHTGGGTKGRTLPDGWQEEIFRFLGFDTRYEFYTMTELIPACPRCTEGNYHVPPVLVPFVLDPENGAPLPRAGRLTGRFAYVDLLASTYWSGLITGDQVTLGGWDNPCSCGRLGPYIEPTITRYTLQQGGDDKVNCAGAPEAHERALEYVLASALG